MVRAKCLCSAHGQKKPTKVAWHKNDGSIEGNAGKLLLFAKERSLTNICPVHAIVLLAALGQVRPIKAPVAAKTAMPLVLKRQPGGYERGAVYGKASIYRLFCAPRHTLPFTSVHAVSLVNHWSRELANE